MSGSLLSENAPGKQVVEDFFPSYAKILIAGNAFLYFCNIFRLPSQMHFYFLFSNAVTQFLEVIKPILSRTCFLAYAPELGYSRKNPNRVCWGNTFLKTTLEIFTPGNSTKLCHTHWSFQGQKPRPMDIPHYFFLDHARKFHFCFYWLLEFPDSIFSIPMEIPCPQSPTHHHHCLFSSGIALEIVTAS